MPHKRRHSFTHRLCRAVQLLYDVFNTFTMQFVLYLVYVFLFQFLISSLRSTSEFYMTKTLFVSRGAT